MPRVVTGPHAYAQFAPGRSALDATGDKDCESLELNLRTVPAPAGKMSTMLHALDHVTFHTTDLPRALAFYVDVLGLRSGPRPPFSIPGAWLYAGERAVLHLVERPVQGRGGAIDHVAFEASGRAAVAARLHAAGIRYDLVALPDRSAMQMFLLDPDGARLELVFKQAEDR